MKKPITEVDGKIYIYGTGLWARNVFQSLKDKNTEIAGFLVTRREENTDYLFGYPVLEYTDVNIDGATTIILGLNQHNSNEVKQHLVKDGFPTDRIYTIKDVMRIDDSRVGYDEVPCIDVTTKVGCAVNCRYCPQDIFVRRYYEKNRERATFLTKEIFSECLRHLPMEANIQFGGFAEPFLNDECLDLMTMACDQGRKVNLYTTLVGLNETKLEDLLKLPIEYVTLHVADEKGYAKIPTTEEYYRLLEKVIFSTRADGKPLVDMCNAQAKPEQRVFEICKDRYEISYTLLDRAGNLEGKELVSKTILKGSIYCGICGNSLNKNELLPDGTVLLCCMDYGMMHTLGNLSEQFYEDIMCGAEMNRVRTGMQDSDKVKILCRKCSSANKVVNQRVNDE